MVQRYGVLAKRLQHAFSRGVLKAKINAAERQIATIQDQSKSLLRESLDGSPSTSGPGLCPNFATTASATNSSGFANLRDTLCFIKFGASRPRPELNNFRISHGFLIPTRGGFIQGGRAMLCSEAARPSTASAAVHNGQGVRGSSVAKNLTRWTQQAGREKSQSMLMYLMAMVVAVVGLTYASVPLYRRFCQATGYGGTVRRRETVEEKIARHGSEDAAASRELVVHFNADVADSMPWKFTPCQNQVKVKVGQSSLAFYTAENTSSEDITGVSTYNVAPMQAGSYFNKIQCFCFEEQRLRPGEKIDMPVLFYIDPEFATDPKMDSINSLILSYTFFKVEDEEDDE
ncbi:unnamed protein product [Calypogeia fissa]